MLLSKIFKVRVWEQLKGKGQWGIGGVYNFSFGHPASGTNPPNFYSSIYLYNGPDVYAEYTSDWSTASATYVHGPNMDDPIARTAGTVTQYYHQDGLGNMVALSGASGTTDATRRYDAWGNTIASTGNMPQFGYTGREPDATGLIYYRARYYDPSVGRFTQRDPSGLSGGINQYAYVNGNPVNYSDPWGLVATGPSGATNTSYYDTFVSAASNLSASDVAHTVLTGASFAPSLIGSAFSILDAGLYAAQGNWTEAGISIGAAAAGIVSDAGIWKLSAQGVKEAAGVVEAAKGANKAPDFVVSSGGTAFPVPKGATGPFPADSGKGFQFTGGSGGNGLNPRTTDVRIMDPVTSGKYQYPNGYGSYGNATGQTVNPFTGQTIRKSDPLWHIPAK